jgi:hypothetical protein
MAWTVETLNETVDEKTPTGEIDLALQTAKEVKA